MKTNIDLVWINNDSEYARLMGHLVQGGVRILVTAGTSASLAAKRQTSTISIVFVAVGDPIGVGLVESLSHPGGNVNGFADILFDLTGKYVGMRRSTTSGTTTVQSYDASSDCGMIQAGIQANNVKFEDLARERGLKTAQNVAAGVVGVVIWPVWFAMDVKGAADSEIASLQARQQYLAKLAEQRCIKGR